MPQAGEHEGPRKRSRYLRRWGIWVVFRHCRVPSYVSIEKSEEVTEEPLGIHERAQSSTDLAALPVHCSWDESFYFETIVMSWIGVRISWDWVGQPRLINMRSVRSNGPMHSIRFWRARTNNQPVNLRCFNMFPPPVPNRACPPHTFMYVTCHKR